MKIVVLDGYTLNPGELSWKALQRLGELTVYDRTASDSDDNSLIVRRAAGAQAVLTNKTPLTAQTLSMLPELRYIGVLATGYNVVDVKAASKQGITVTNVPDYATGAVAQMAVALLLELCNHVGEHSRSIKNGEWTRNADWCYWKYPLIELAGKTLGIIGYGRIGRAVARVAHALGMKVLAHDKTAFEADGTAEYVALDELYRLSDVISLHCPLTEDTKGIINQASIARMRDGVLIVNNSRGQLIVEKDLADALENGKVGGAAVDVASTEPIREDNPLLSARNCIITPHISWATKEARMRLMDIAADNLAAFLSGKPRNVVNGGQG